MCTGSTVVCVLDSHSCAQGSNPNIRYALISTQFISNESYAEMVL